MLGVLLAQERSSALDLNCYGIPRPIEVRHARHLSIQDSGVLVRRRHSMATEGLVASSIDLSAAHTTTNRSAIPHKAVQSDILSADVHLLKE